MIYTAFYESLLGKILLASKNNAIMGLWIEGQKHYPTFPYDKTQENNNCNILKQAKDWLNRYFADESPSPFELNLKPEVNDFSQNVWRILCKIPYGKTTTYSNVAAEIARERCVSKMSAQAVGGAVGRNPISIIIPCHRIIGKNGNLTGYASGLDNKVKLLSHEGSLSRDFSIYN